MMAVEKHGKLKGVVKISPGTILDGELCNNS